MTEIPLDHTQVVFHNQLKLINALSAQFITFRVSFIFFQFFHGQKEKEASSYQFVSFSYFKRQRDLLLCRSFA